MPEAACSAEMSIKENLYRPVGALRTLCKTARRRSASDKEPRVFLLNIPSHGNLGDHLISIAEQSFLKTYFPESQVVLITSADLFFSIKFALSDVRKEDILCVTGGGFMGSLYAEEDRFLKIIKQYHDNKIVFFPQSFYYAPGNDRQTKIDRAAKVYRSHNKLFVAARDQDSYNLLEKELMPYATDRICLAPDIALYLCAAAKHNREGALLCLRNDAEALKANASLTDRIKADLADRGLAQRTADTYVHRSVPLDKETEEVSALLEKFSKAELVVTDRLHGMIAAVITGTPAIVLDNSTGKVKQAYEMWLKDIPYVKFVEEPSSIKTSIDQVLSVKDCSYNNEVFKRHYLPIIDAINA